jgi:hypothetical protein
VTLHEPATPVVVIVSTTGYSMGTGAEELHYPLSVMTRTAYLQAFTVRQLRIHARRNGVYILQSWTKPQLIAAIVKAAA